MVCKKCEKKLSKVAAPDPFQATSSSTKDGSRKIGGHNALSRPPPAKAGPSKRFTPYGNYGNKCKDCKQPTTQNGAKYCHGCAFKKGLCSICGKQILDTTGYSMSAK